MRMGKATGAVATRNNGRDKRRRCGFGGHAYESQILAEIKGVIIPVPSVSHNCGSEVSRQRASQSISEVETVEHGDKFIFPDPNSDMLEETYLLSNPSAANDCT